jgi:hypothetical protein
MWSGSAEAALEAHGEKPSWSPGMEKVCGGIVSELGLKSIGKKTKS